MSPHRGVRRPQGFLVFNYASSVIIHHSGGGGGLEYGLLGNEVVQSLHARGSNMLVSRWGLSALEAGDLTTTQPIGKQRLSPLNTLYTYKQIEK